MRIGPAPVTWHPGPMVRDRVWSTVKSFTHKPLFLFRKVDSVTSKWESLVVLNMDNEGLWASQPHILVSNDVFIQTCAALSLVIPSLPDICTDATWPFLLDGRPFLSNQQLLTRGCQYWLSSLGDVGYQKLPSQHRGWGWLGLYGLGMQTWAASEWCGIWKQKLLPLYSPSFTKLVPNSYFSYLFIFITILEGAEV